MDSNLEDLSKQIDQVRITRQAFPFFDLPIELRWKILSYNLTEAHPIDLDPNNYRSGRQRLDHFLVSYRFHAEAAHIFYSTHAFRIFPTHGRFFSHKTKPLLQRLPTRYRELLTTLELRLGPGWSNPPKSWWVDSRLGLEEMVNVRTLKVFVECDPSHDIFKGFRIGKDFFTEFAAHLLQEITRRLPALSWAEFDGWPSVMREGPLMRKLVAVAKDNGLRIIEMGDLVERESCQDRAVWHFSELWVPSAHDD